jgi:hypothetical protein
MNDPEWPLREDPAFAEIWRLVQPYTMTSPQRGYALWRAVNHVIDANIPGSFVECGLWRGGSSMLMALTLMARGVERDLVLFDTFDGMTPPVHGVDQDLNGHEAATFMAGQFGAVLAEMVTARAGFPEVRSAILGTGYSPRRVRFVIGDVRETLLEVEIPRIALLRLDTDFYDSTRAELEHLYPRVGQGGVVIVDDYGHWRGARQAVDEYFANRETGAAKPMFWAMDYTGRGWIKPD